MKRIVYSVLAASAAAAVMSGCSASEIVNTGGDTKCKDYPHPGREEAERRSQQDAEGQERPGSDESGDHRDEGLGHALLPGARQGRHEDLRGAARLSGSLRRYRVDRQRYDHRPCVAARHRKM